jgi:hypothetical protein
MRFPKCDDSIKLYSSTPDTASRGDAAIAAAKERDDDFTL